MNLEIRFTLPEQAPRIIPLSESRLLIGALLSNEVVVRAPGVDPIHAMIEDNDDGEKVVIDLGSHNGVVLNGQRVEVEAAIKAGDVITLGNVRIEVLQAGTAAAAEQQQEDAPVPAPPVMGSSAVQTAGGTGHGTGAPESVQASAAESMHTGQPVSGHATGGAQPVSGHATAGAQPVSQPDAPVSSHPAPEHDDDAIAATVRTNQATNKRGEQLFSPRKARPQGNVLEVVSYWGDTILDVELFDRRTKGYEVCTIGDGTDSHLPAGGSQEVPGHVLAKPGSDGFKVYLMEDMKARIRKGGKVFEKNGKSRLSLARRDVVHISHGAVRYFLMFVKPPPLDLPPNRARDPLFVALLTVAMLFYFSVVPIIWMTKPVPENQLEDDAWALVNLPEKKKEPEKPKKKPKTKQKLVEKKKPPPPKPPKPKPRKPVPVKPTTKAVVKKKPKKTVPVKAKVKAKTPAKQLANTKNKVRPRKPSKTPSNRQKQKQAGKPSLNKLKKAAGMASTGAKKPNFKLAGARAKNKSLKTGGAKGSGMNQRGGARKGKRAHSYMGVEGVKNNKASGVNLSKLGLGAGKILNKTGPSAIHTKFRNSAGGAGGGSGSASKTYGFGGMGNGRSLGLAGAGSVANNFGHGAGGPGGGRGGTGGLGGAGLGRGFGTKGAGGRGGRGGAGRANVVVPPGDPVVSGGLTSQEVQAVIRANLNQIRHCYEQTLQRSPNAAGKIKVRFVVAPSGRVTSASIAMSTVRDSRMKGCVTGKVRRWRFPKPRGGQAVTVSYPFVFNPL